jgi:putative phosphoribosyl transferase
MRFRDRTEAGEKLAQILAQKYGGQPGAVYALPRGGIAVGVPIARALNMPLDLAIARKIGHPLQPEYAIGAVTEHGEPVINAQAVEHVDREWFRSEVEAERQEARRRHAAYTGSREPVTSTGKTAILVDDGIATGLTMRAAIQEVRQQRPAKIVVAVPVVPPETAAELTEEVDEVVAVDVPNNYLGAVGAYYKDFHQVDDEEVRRLLQHAGSSEALTEQPLVGEFAVNIQLDGVSLSGDLGLMEQARGIVLFAHGSGSSRASPRNRVVARVLQRADIATLLFDLLTEDEDLIYRNRFDIAQLRRRLQGVTDWIAQQPALARLPIGYFGASTGSAAALEAAAERSDIRAIVSRGGRPDLAMAVLPRIRAATLLIVGSNDEPVLSLNRTAYAALTTTEKDLQIVSGATHLFQEPGALERVAQLATDWFQTHLR